MKLLTTFIGVFIFCASSAHATSAGFHAGLNSSNITGDIVGNSSKLGFKFGGHLEFKIDDWFFLQPGAVFSMKGTKDTATDIRTNLNYIDFPFLMKAKFEAGGWSPYLIVGPQIGFAINKTTSAGTTLTDIKTLDFGLDFGAGIELPVGEGMGWFVDGRYELGLLNIFDNQGNTAITTSQKNSNISFNTGINFDI